MSNNQYNEILLNYESSRLARKQFHKIHDRELNAEKSREICAGFAQSRQYMISAAASDRAVRPLLVYCGILSISRALTLFLSTRLREAGLAQSHGLSAKQWDAELTKDNGSIANLNVEINNSGTFIQLMEATKYNSYLRSNSSSPNLVFQSDPISAGSVITVGELLDRTPEVADTLIRWRSELQAIAFWPQGTIANGKYHIKIETKCNPSDIARIFGQKYEIIRDDNGILNVYSDPNDAVFSTLSDTGGAWNIGNIVTMTPFRSVPSISKIGTAFLISYALGMLVRYYPSRWIDMLQNQRHDEALPTLLSALRYIEAEFPRYIVDFLEMPTSIKNDIEKNNEVSSVDAPTPPTNSSSEN